MPGWVEVVGGVPHSGTPVGVGRFETFEDIKEGDDVAFEPETKGTVRKARAGDKVIGQAMSKTQYVKKE